MQLMREKTSSKISREREHDLWTRLGEQFQPLLVDVSLELRRTLQLPIAEVSRGGELFRAGDGDLLYYSISDDRKSVEIGAIYAEFPPQKAYEDFRQTITDAVGAGKWSRISTLNERSQQMQEETEPFPQGSADLESAKVLANPLFRQLLQETAKRTGITLESSPLMSPEEVAKEEGVEALERCGLIQREFQVFCRDTGIQLCKFNSRAALSEAATMGFRSFSSGRPINQERIVQFLCISDRGRWLSRRNLWLALCLADQLRELGVQPSQLRWTYERDYRTVLMLTAYQQAHCMFAVQEDSLTPDEAFRFFSRVRYYRPDAAFLVTPEELRQDARQVVARLSEELKDSSIYIVSDLAELEPRLLDVVARTNRKIIGDLLGRFGALTKVEVGQAVAEHLLGAEPVVSLREETQSEENMTPVVLEEVTTRTADSLLDLDLDLDLSDLELTPRSSSSQANLDDFDLDLDLDTLDFIKSKPVAEPKPAAELDLPVTADLDSLESENFDEELALPPNIEAATALAANSAYTATQEPSPVNEPEALNVTPEVKPMDTDAGLGLDLDVDFDFDLSELDEKVPVTVTPEPVATEASITLPSEIAELEVADTVVEEPAVEEPPVPEVVAEPVVEAVPVISEPEVEDDFLPEISLTEVVANESTPVIEEPTVVPEPHEQPPVAEIVVAPELNHSMTDDNLPNLDLDLDLDLDLNLDLDLGLPPLPTTAEPSSSPQVEATPIPEVVQSVFDLDSPQESFPEITTPVAEKSNEERLEAATAKCLESLAQFGARADLEEALQDIRELPLSGGLLSSLDGFSLQGRIRDEATTEYFSAHLPDLWSTCIRSCAEAELAMPNTIVAEGAAGRLETHLLADSLVFSVHQQLADLTEDAHQTLPGEMSLREAILRKVLEDLSELTEVTGNLVVSRDGLIVENQVGDDALAHRFSIVATQVLADCESCCTKLGLAPVKQLILKSSSHLLSLMPLDAETILLTAMVPEASRDVWQLRLQGAAQMLSSVFQ
jgi:predicted regulator of Ras-like GTPase activity (Roadblock/LC7/MglB family)